MKINRKALVIAVVGALTLATLPAMAQGVMFVKNNRVGIGTDNPVEPLHVKGTTAGGFTLARIENSTAGSRAGARFVNGVSTWDFRNDGLGDFVIDFTPTPGPEMLVRNNGEVRMGPGGVINFRLFTNGNLTILGTLTQNSSRTSKESITELDGQEILERVAGLDVLEWSYIGQDSRHIGPMAEDFYATFGLGLNDKGVAPSDVAGITLAAVQGLYSVVQEKQSEVEQLRAELAELRAVVETLTQR